MLGIDSARSRIDGERQARPSRSVSWHRTGIPDVERAEIRGGGECRGMAAASGTARPIPVTGIKTRQKGESRGTWHRHDRGRRPTLRAPAERWTGWTGCAESLAAAHRRANCRFLRFPRSRQPLMRKRPATAIAVTIARFAKTNTASKSNRASRASNRAEVLAAKESMLADKLASKASRLAEMLDSKASRLAMTSVFMTSSSAMTS